MVLELSQREPVGILFYFILQDVDYRGLHVSAFPTGHHKVIRFTQGNYTISSVQSQCSPRSRFVNKILKIK